MAENHPTFACLYHARMMAGKMHTLHFLAHTVNKETLKVSYSA
jgi:hypothetical protein